MWAPVAGYLLAWAVPFAVFGWLFHTVSRPWLEGAPAAMRVGLAALFQLVAFLILGPPRPGFRVTGPLPSLAVTLLLIPVVMFVAGQCVIGHRECGFRNKEGGGRRCVPENGYAIVVPKQ